MNWILKNILVFIGAYITGSIVNLALVFTFMALIPPPEGFDIMNPDADFGVLLNKHFIGPFIAHAAGVFVGAFIVAKWAATWNKGWALVVGGLFFIGGLMMIMDKGAPTWFIVLDLGLAYIPCALLAHKVGRKK